MTRILWLSVLLAGWVAEARGQQRFELVVPGSNQVSRAVRTDRTLEVVDSAGERTEYQRDPRYDSADGQLLGYRSSVARQILRWPVSNRGRLEISADSQRPVFRASQMEIRSLGPDVAAIAMADIDPDTAYRVVPAMRGQEGQALATDGGGDLQVAKPLDEDRFAWHLTPVSNGLYRLHSDARGRSWSLTARPDDRPHLTRTGNSLDQLWQISDVPGQAGQLVLTRVDGGIQPKALALAPNGRLALNPRNWAAGQCWYLVKLGPRLPPVFGGYRFVSKETRLNPPLPPAQVELLNRHSKELWILLVDRQLPAGSLRLRIPAGRSEKVQLQRDAGATLVEVYENVLPNGVAQREEFVSALPPAVRYDLSVYELIIQSVAIDRTVPGGKLEDVQQAPRSVGWLELPPGPELSDGPLDTYAAAIGQENPGQVRRIDPAQWQAPAVKADPVESLLKKFQK